MGFLRKGVQKSSWACSLHAGQQCWVLHSKPLNLAMHFSSPQVKAESHSRGEGLPDGVDSGASHQVAAVQEVLNRGIDLHARADPSARRPGGEQGPTDLAL